MESFITEHCEDPEFFSKLYESEMFQSANAFATLINLVKKNTSLMTKLKASMPYTIEVTDGAREIVLKEGFSPYSETSRTVSVISAEYSFLVALLWRLEKDVFTESVMRISSLYNQPQWLSHPFPGDIFDYIDPKGETELLLLVASKNRHYVGESGPKGPFALPIALNGVARLMDESSGASLDVLLQIMKGIRKNSSEVFGKSLRAILDRADDKSAFLVFNLLNFIIDHEKTEAGRAYSFKKVNQITANEYGNYIYKAIRRQQFALANVLVNGASKKDLEEFFSVSKIYTFAPTPECFIEAVKKVKISETRQSNYSKKFETVASWPIEGKPKVSEEEASEKGELHAYEMEILGLTAPSLKILHYKKVFQGLIYQGKTDAVKDLLEKLTSPGKPQVAKDFGHDLYKRLFGVEI